MTGLIRDSDVQICIMSFDNVAVGRLQGQFIVDQLPKIGHRPLRLVRGFTVQRRTTMRCCTSRGRTKRFKPHIDNADIVVVQADWADDWRPENAKRIMNAAVTNSGRDIDAVLASNDGTAGGAIQALSEEGLVGKVLVTGQDAELVACQRIEQGTQAMTVYKPIKNLASYAAEMAIAMAQRRPSVNRDRRR